MRITVDPALGGEIACPHQRITVTLNGEEVTRCICADSDKGEVVVLDTDDNDNLIVKNGEVIYKTLHGSVDIEIKTTPL